MIKKKIIFTLLFLIVFTTKLSARRYIMIETSYGNIYIKLYKDTRIHSKNFYSLVNNKYFDSTTFHRVIKGFMIQGGDPYSKNILKKDSIGEGGPGYQLKSEFKRKHFHKRGVIAAARNSDEVNSKRESSGSQFYIVQGRKFTDQELDKFEQRISNAIGRSYKFSLEERKFYKEKGGAPWLDMQYTIFGEVVAGIETVDKIASVETNKEAKPNEDIVMKIKVVKLKKQKIKALKKQME